MFEVVFFYKDLETHKSKLVFVRNVIKVWQHVNCFICKCYKNGVVSTITFSKLQYVLSSVEVMK